MKFDLKTSFLWIVYAIHLYFFYFVIIWKVGFQIREKCLGNWRCSHYLQVTSYGYWVDSADHQWREFRNNLVLLVIVAFGTSLIDRLCYHFRFNVAFSRMIIGIIVILVQHQYYAIITLLLALMGYGITKTIKCPVLGKTLTWIFAIFVLLLKESYRIQHRPGWQWLRYLFINRYSGMYNWRLPANFLVLRIISYNIDYYNAISSLNSFPVLSPFTTPQSTPSSSTKDNNSEKIEERNNINTEKLLNAQTIANNYNIFNYFSYITYAPLYMAGPIITYSNYLLYQKQPQNQENIIIYTIRFIYCYALMEYLISTFPCFAIISSNLLPHLSLLEIFITFYLLLKIMWLKFLLLWRFFRLWSCIDGILPPENMIKCMSNNYSLEQFWKYWHTSFNQWIIKYIYIPLGGKHYQLMNVWIIFLFVALWHDLEWKLMIWGLMNAFFYIIEVIVVYKIRPRLFSSIKEKEEKNEDISKNRKETGSRGIFIRVFDSFFGALYIMILMLINLIGYSMGAGAIPIVMTKMLTWEGGKVIAGSIYFLFIGVNIMFSIEEWRTKKSTHIINAKKTN
eukprot:gene1880-2012_t